MIRKLKLAELGRISKEEYEKKEKFPVRLILDNIRSAFNVGSCFRTADGCAVNGIDLCGITALPPHKEINKSALGADENVHWEHFSDIKYCLEKRLEEGYKIIALEQTNKSISLQDWTFSNYNEKIAFIFGNEVQGVSDFAIKKAHHIIEIPQFGTKHSHNIGVAVGMTLWHYLSLQLKNNPKII